MIFILQRLKNKLVRIIKKERTAFYTKDFFIGKKYKIGNYTYGCPQVLFDNSDANLIIGKFSSIGEGVVIFLGGNHRTDWITTYPFNAIKDFHEARIIKGHPSTKGDVIIGNDVWIGRNVKILSGISIGNGSVIGSESVVTKKVGAYEIWAGNPAKFIRKRFDEITIEKLESIAWWDWEISKIKKNVNVLCSNNINRLNNFYDK